MPHNPLSDESFSQKFRAAVTRARDQVAAVSVVCEELGDMLPVPSENFLKLFEAYSLLGKAAEALDTVLHGPIPVKH